MNEVILAFSAGLLSITNQVTGNPKPARTPRISSNNPGENELSFLMAIVDDAIG